MPDLPHPIRLATDAQRQFAASYIMDAAPAGTWVQFKPDRRSLAQNALLWARLAQLSREVKWNGQHLTEYEFKDLLTASLRAQKLVPGIDGGLVLLGARTSAMTKPEMADLLTLMEAFAAERGVTFADQEISYAR